jgi:hypothetical protein
MVPSPGSSWTRRRSSHQGPIAVTEAKTRPSGSSVEEYLAARTSADQLADCKALVALRALDHARQAQVRQGVPVLQAAR